MTKDTVTYFKLPGNIDMLANFLESVLNGFTPYNFQENMQWRIKWILTELATNAYKHGSVEDTYFSFIVDDQKVVISKSEVSDPPFFYTACNTPDVPRAAIYSDTDILFAEKTNDSTIRFTEANDDPAITDASLTHEHFGLLIITRSADFFTFSFDPASKTSTFKACLLLAQTEILYQ